MKTDRLAEILHEAGLNAYTHPQNLSASEWNKFRRKLAKQILSKCEVNEKITKIATP